MKISTSNCPKFERGPDLGSTLECTVRVLSVPWLIARVAREADRAKHVLPLSLLFSFYFWAAAPRETAYYYRALGRFPLTIITRTNELLYRRSQ